LAIEHDTNILVKGSVDLPNLGEIKTPEKGGGKL